MKILNKDYVKKMQQLRTKYKLELSDYECECYSNMFNVSNDVVDNQYTFEQLLDTYNFFTDVLDGKRVDIDLFTYEDAFKGEDGIFVDKYEIYKRITKKKDSNIILNGRRNI